MGSFSSLGAPFMLPGKLHDAGGGPYTSLMHTPRVPTLRFFLRWSGKQTFSSPPTIHLPHFLRVLILEAKILRTPPCTALPNP